MHCLICDTKTESSLDPQTNFTYHFCQACGFIGKDPANFPSSTEEFEEYELHQNSLEDERYVAFFEQFLQAAVFPFVKKGRKALDFGSGPSPVLAQLMERDYNYDYTIYDKIYQPDTHYKESDYDLITVTEVMEHIAEPLLVFQELGELLKAGGILSIMTLFPPAKRADFFHWYYRHEVTHLSFYTSQSMNIIAKKIGLELIYCDNKRYTTFRKKESLIR